MHRTLTGTLVVKPQMGQFDKNYDVIGAMDPYCVVQVGASRQETNVAKGQGKEPKWEDALHFPIKGEQFLYIDCFDYDVVGSHDYIGRAQVDLTQALGRGHVANWVPVLDQAQQKVGQVYLSLDIVTQGAAANMPAGYVPHAGPVANILGHNFGDWARLHPGYVRQPVDATGNSHWQQASYGVQAPGSQLGGYSHVQGPVNGFPHSQYGAVQRF